MHTQSSSPSLQSWDVRYEINAPLSPYHTDLMEEKEAQSVCFGLLACLSPIDDFGGILFQWRV